MRKRKITVKYAFAVVFLGSTFTWKKFLSEICGVRRRWQMTLCSSRRKEKKKMMKFLSPASAFVTVCASSRILVVELLLSDAEVEEKKKVFFTVKAPYVDIEKLSICFDISPYFVKNFQEEKFYQKLWERQQVDFHINSVIRFENLENLFFHRTQGHPQAVNNLFIIERSLITAFTRTQNSSYWDRLENKSKSPTTNCSF